MDVWIKWWNPLKDLSLYICYSTRFLLWEVEGKSRKITQSCKSIALLKENLNRNLCSLCCLIVLTVVTNYCALERQWEFLLKLEYIRENHKLQYIFLPLCGSEEFITRRREKLRMMMVTANESWGHVFLSRWCVTNGDVEQRNLFISSSYVPKHGTFIKERSHKCWNVLSQICGNASINSDLC